MDKPVLRPPQFMSYLGFASKGNFMKCRREGLLPEPFKIGRRAAAYLKSEADQINTAYAAGWDDNKMRALTRRIHAERESAGRELERLITQ